MFLKKDEEKILRKRESSLMEEEEKSKFLYDMMINGESDNKEFRVVASNYTKLKYSVLTLNCLINDLRSLNNCTKNKSMTKSIFEEDTYNEVKDLYANIRWNVQYLCENALDIDDFREYRDITLKAERFMKNVDFDLVINEEDVTLNSDNIAEVTNFKFRSYKDIFWTSLDQNWDYNTFMRKISLYKEYYGLLCSADKYHASYESEENDKYLEESPAYIIEHNPSVLKEDLFDKRTLLEAKKVMYEHARMAKGIDDEENILNAISSTNVTLKKH